MVAEITASTHLSVLGVREASELKNVTKSGKSPKIKKSKILKLDFLKGGGGVWIIRFFPNVNVDFKCFS